MTDPRYLDRRRDRAQNGAAGGLSRSPGRAIRRVRTGAAGSRRPPASCRRARTACAGGPWRTAGGGPLGRAAGCGPVWRTGGCAGPAGPGARSGGAAARPARRGAARGRPAVRRQRQRRRRPAVGAAPRVRPLPGGDVAVRGGHAGHPLGDGGAGRGDPAGVRRRPVGAAAGVRAAPRPAGRRAGAHARHHDARRARGHPAEAEGGLAPAHLGAFVRAEHAVADRGEQVLERLAVDEHRHGDERDHHDLERPGQHLVGGAHDQRVAVEQDAQRQRDRDLFQQHADEHLEPADRDHPAEARMDADDQEERPGDEQQQEAELQHDQGQRDQQDEQARRDRGEQRLEPDLQPGRPLVALEQRVDRRVGLLQVLRDAVVDRLLRVLERAR